MTGFLSAALFFLAACAVLGTIPPSILAVKAEKPVLAVLMLLIATWVVYVLVASAANLHHR